ncbi:HDOD domain-containing protein [Fusibacter sp. JL216-2]|uniref:HDOD domain-containing protein n=1 Tax=Fusibacter sp. JL216-2 TaxID=3071453 RepID=UPI003D332BC8
MKRILFVDDEKQILRALKRLFVSSDYEVHFAESGEKALQLIESNDFDLLVTDIRMPEMDGLELLRQVKSESPLTLRVALSGYTDNKKIYSALEDNLAKLYLFKPWDNKELTSLIDRLFELEDILKDKKLLNLINNLDELPTVPDLYAELCRMVEENADIEAIAKKLEEDQSIASKLLRVANSAFYGAKTGSISQAIMYIGLINVKNIVLSNGIFTSLGIDRDLQRMLWEHVNLTNRLMNAIYQKCLFKKVPNMFASAGLLRDIGRVIIYQYFMEEFKEALNIMKENPNKSIVEIENETIGVDHQKIGGYLLNWWEIPVPIIEAALFHHDPLNDAVMNKELVCVVHIANYYSWKMLDDQSSSQALKVDVLDYLRIEEDNLNRVIDEFTKELGKSSLT